MGPVEKTAQSLTEGPLAFAAELLRAVMPDFKFRVLPATKIPSGLGDDIDVKPKLAVELPEARAHLRLGLLDEMNERVGGIFSSDSRSSNGVCTGAVDPKKVIDKVDNAIKLGKLDGLTLDHLEEVTPQERKDEAIAMKTGLLRAPKPATRHKG